MIKNNSKQNSLLKSFIEKIFQREAICIEFMKIAK